MQEGCTPDATQRRHAGTAATWLHMVLTAAAPLSSRIEPHEQKLLHSVTLKPSSAGKSGGPVLPERRRHGLHRPRARLRAVLPRLRRCGALLATSMSILSMLSPVASATGCYIAVVFHMFASTEQFDEKCCSHARAHDCARVLATAAGESNIPWLQIDKCAPVYIVIGDGGNEEVRHSEPCKAVFTITCSASVAGSVGSFCNESRPFLFPCLLLRRPFQNHVILLSMCSAERHIRALPPGRSSHAPARAAQLSRRSRLQSDQATYIHRTAGPGGLRFHRPGVVRLPGGFLRARHPGGAIQRHRQVVLATQPGPLQRPHRGLGACWSCAAASCLIAPESQVLSRNMLLMESERQHSRIAGLCGQLAAQQHAQNGSGG